MALNKDQVKMLEGMKGIDQTLLGTYKKNNPGVQASDTVNKTKETDDFGVSRVTGFNAALNVAIGQAREQRKDSVLDMVGGMVPSGALKASSFASVLNAFNADAAPLESTLINNAAQFAQDQENRKQEIKMEISNLALKVGTNGGSQDTVNAILALMDSGDIGAAVKIAATGLAKTGASDGGNGSVVDKEGNPIWEISNTSLWDSGKQGPIFEASKFDDEFTDKKVVTTAELEAEMSRLMNTRGFGDKKLLISGYLKNDNNRREFMDDWVEYQEMIIGGPVDPLEYLSVWEKEKGLSLIPVKKDVTKEEPKDIYDELYGENDAEKKK